MAQDFSTFYRKWKKNDIKGGISVSSFDDCIYFVLWEFFCFKRKKKNQTRLSTDLVQKDIQTGSGKS